MDSPARTSQSLVSRILPFWAILTEDLRQTLRHWALWSWVILAVIGSVFVLTSAGKHASPSQNIAASDPSAPGSISLVSMTSSAGGSEGETALNTASSFVVHLLQMHLIFWASLVLALGATTIAAEAEYAPESILCRGVSRWQYYAAKCCSRASIVFAAFWLLTLPWIAVGAARLTNDLTFGGLMGVLFQQSMLLVCLSLLSVAASAWFKTPLVSVAVCWMIVYGVGVITSILEIGAVSPFALAPVLQMTLQGITPETPAATVSHLPSLIHGTSFLGVFTSGFAFSLRDL